MDKATSSFCAGLSCLPIGWHVVSANSTRIPAARIAPSLTPIRVRDQAQGLLAVPIATTRQQGRSYNSPTSLLGR